MMLGSADAGATDCPRLLFCIGDSREHSETQEGNHNEIPRMIASSLNWQKVLMN
jgi:hypothetical protein